MLQVKEVLCVSKPGAGHHAHSSLAVAGIVVVFYDYFWAFKRPAEVMNFKSISNLPFLFGVVIYSYEGVGMILPVEASMKRKEKFPLTLAFVMAVITAIYVSFGAVGA